MGILYKRWDAHISRGGAEVARRAHNPKVDGSIPSPAPKMEKDTRQGVLFRFRCSLSGRTIEMAAAISWFCARTNYDKYHLQRKTVVQIPSPAPNK